VRRLTTLAALLLSTTALVHAESPTAPLERSFDAAIDPAEMGAWLKTLSAEPSHVGSPHDKANAEMVLSLFKQWGWDAKIEEFQVLYPTPISETLEVTGAHPYKVKLTEPEIPGDESSKFFKDGLPAYVAYQGDGDVTAPAVYVNYGMPADYDQLERLGISVKGKIVITRYGKGWRGLKPKLAQEHGAVGCIIYSDPHEDGFAVDDSYPNGPARPEGGLQRGSVQDMTLYPGDPLTPGIGATKNAKRLKREDAKTILKIPALPISWGEAQHLLATLDGPVVPRAWAGNVPLTYHVGGNGAPIHLAVKSDWSLKPLYNVVAMLKGSDYPDQWVLRGNHRDGWVFGASDPLSGQVAMLEEAKSFGLMAKQGWKPKRTLVYLSWDGEEPGLLGSTEWVEEHADELHSKAVLYLNSDGNSRGFLFAGGNHSLRHLVASVASDVTDPETKVSVEDRLRGRAQVEASEPGASDSAKEAAKPAADGHDMPIGALGSGSDYSAFLQHVGVASIDIGYGGEGESGGVYHSDYDDFAHHSRFVDPGFAYAAALAKTAGHMMLRVADADLPVNRYGDFADQIGIYLDEVKKLSKTKRETAETQAKLLAGNLYRLADDPTKPSAPPTALKAVPQFDFKPLEEATERLKKSAEAYDQALSSNGASLPAKTKGELTKLTIATEEALTIDAGLPGRPWFRNLVYAPGRFTGYGAKTLPGVREAIEEERWDDAVTYIGLTAKALQAYADKLDEGVKLINKG
jgi:N-acetylated-alpha-linked acidic dipeptidase